MGDLTWGSECRCLCVCVCVCVHTRACPQSLVMHLLPPLTRSPPVASLLPQTLKEERSGM